MMCMRPSGILILCPSQAMYSIQSLFPGARLLFSHRSRFAYLLPLSHPLGAIFARMEDGRLAMGVRQYTVAQASWHQMFTL